MSATHVNPFKLPPNFWRGVLIFSVLWMIVGFGAAIAWDTMNPPDKHNARMIKPR